MFVSCHASSSDPAFIRTNGSFASQELISEENWNLLSDRGRTALRRLIQSDALGAQVHVYGDWPVAGVDDEGKVRLGEEIADLDMSYPGGLPAYLSKARALLKESADGTNPFSDFMAYVPDGESLSYDDDHTDANNHKSSAMSFSEAEQRGLHAIEHVAIVVVAGGVGERLGQSGIKLELVSDLVTNETYLQGYCRYILTLQDRANDRLQAGNKKVRLPLVIMTSGDTDHRTRTLLADNNNFGLEQDQVQIVCQGKVAALKDSLARLSLNTSDRWMVNTKPHGHGDVHHLLYRDRHVDAWLKDGRTHVVFLQDTNSLVINGILPALGVSLAKGFHMNSICIPRLAGEDVGAIVRLEHKTDPNQSMVINVEYNQLDPLLKTQGNGQGDVPDPNTGYSPFPGNANNFILELTSYAHTLRGEDQGVVVEFVNPKYTDETRTKFIKQTRLECMMQDLPKLFKKEMGNDVKIGFTRFDRWLSFSPAKNSRESGIEALASGKLAPATISSAESDKYIQNQRKLRHAGMNLHVSTEQDLVKVGGIPITPGPRIVLSPSFAVTREEVVRKVHGGKITDRSTLVLDGQGLNVNNLILDGSLVLKTGPGVELEVDGLVVNNRGYELEELHAGGDANTITKETDHIRGYTMAKHETILISIKGPAGKYKVGGDGVVHEVNEKE